MCVCVGDSSHHPTGPPSGSWCSTYPPPPDKATCITVTCDGRVTRGLRSVTLPQRVRLHSQPPSHRRHVLYTICLSLKHGSNRGASLKTGHHSFVFPTTHHHTFPSYSSVLFLYSEHHTNSPLSFKHKQHFSGLQFPLTANLWCHTCQHIFPFTYLLSPGDREG